MLSSLKSSSVKIVDRRILIQVGPLRRDDLSNKYCNKTAFLNFCSRLLEFAASITLKSSSYLLSNKKCDN